MLKFEKKYKYDENDKPLAMIYNGNKLYGFVSYHDTPEVSEEENIFEDDILDDSTCEYCKKNFFSKFEKNRHLKGNICKAKMIQDFLRYSGKGKKLSEDLTITNGAIKTSGEMKMRPLPDMNKRENIVIVGPQDSGKSYYAAMYAKAFEQIKPDHKIILVSRIDDDESFNEFDDLIKLPITEELLENPIDVKEELSKSLTIFDDISNSMLSKQLNNYMFDLNTETLVNGRDQSKQDNDIYTVTTLHITEGLKTRKIIHESTCLVVFTPIGYQEDRLLQLYASLKKQQISKLKKLKTRWIAAYTKKNPAFVMYEHGLILLSEL